MKISVLTPTYNRADLLHKLYKSLLINAKYGVQIEWIVMDDGSTDNTKEVMEKFIKEKVINIKYYYQENKGKMFAINQIVKYATGDLIIECDSDDYFTENAFEVINSGYKLHKNRTHIYGLCFLKYDQDGNNMGNLFGKEITTMYDLYFKEGETGEKALVFFSNIRKKYKYELEGNEKFITEARMFHKMDKDYKMIYINEPIMICEYQPDGYSKNIKEQYKKYPKGYYKYFKEIITEHDFKNAKFRKKLYAIKHFVYFWILTR